MASSRHRSPLIYIPYCSTNSGCLTFSVSKWTSARVTGSPGEIYINIYKESECLEMCIRTNFSCTAVYDENNRRCYVYTSCGSDCARSSNADFVTLEKQCMSGKVFVFQDV